MAVFLARRLLYAILTLLGVSFIVFALIRLLPGEPIDYYRAQLGVGAVDQAALAEVRKSYRLDDPLLLQYGGWLIAALSGDLGFSFIDREPVTSKIRQRLGETLLLNGVALLFSFLVAIPLGVVLSSKRRVAAAADTALVLLFSVPAFWLALLLVSLFVMRAPLFPLFGSASYDAESLSFSARMIDRLRHLVLPVLCLSAAQIAMITRVTRGAMDDAMAAEHIVAARARGVSERSIVFRHALRVAFVPLISMFGVLLPFVLSGSVVIERIFQWKGIGSLFLDSIMTRDYPVVMGLTLVTAVVVLAGSIVVDFLYTLADPRVRVLDARA